MTFQELASLIAKQEGKTKEVSVGNVREILRITLSHLSLMSTVDLGTMLKPYVKKTVKKFKTNR